MTESRNQMADTEAGNEVWCEEDDELIELTDLAPLKEEEDEILDLGDVAQPVEQEPLAERFDLSDDTLDLEDALAGDMEKLLDLSDDTLSLGEAADEEVFELEEVVPKKEESASFDEPDDDPLELTALLDEVIPDEEVVLDSFDTPSEGGFQADGGIVDIDLLLADDDEEALEPMEGFDGEALMAEEELSGDGFLESLSDETLVLEPLDEEEPLELEASASEDAGLLDGMLDETLVLSTDDGPLGPETEFSEEGALGFLSDLDDKPLALSGADAPKALEDEPPLEMVEEAFELEASLLSFEEELPAPEPVSEAFSLEASMMDEATDAVDSFAEGDVLDLSALVDAVPEASLKERKAPGYPKGTFDLSGIVEEEPSFEKTPAEEAVDEALDMAMAEGSFTNISDAQLERVVERVVTQVFKDRIEEMIVDAIGKNLSEEIERMKAMVKENLG